MSRQPLTGDVTALLTAVVDALTIPLPSLDAAAERAHYALLQRRTLEVRVVLEVLLDQPGAVDLVRDAKVIRERTAATPVTYTVWRGPTDGEVTR